jgi:hypothetical protein
MFQQKCFTFQTFSQEMLGSWQRTPSFSSGVRILSNTVDAAEGEWLIINGQNGANEMAEITW